MVLLYAILIFLSITLAFLPLYLLREWNWKQVNKAGDPTQPAPKLIIKVRKKQRPQISRREKVSRNLDLLRILEGK